MKLNWDIYITEPSGTKHYKAFDTVPNIFKRVKNYFKHAKTIQETTTQTPSARPANEKTGSNQVVNTRTIPTMQQLHTPEQG